MPEKTSRRIFIGELFIIVLPLSLLLLFATVVQVTGTLEFFKWYNIANSLFVLIAWVALISGLMISRVFVKQGSSGLRDLKPILWIFSLPGVALILVSEASRLLPPPPPYSQAEMFRDDFGMFVLGLPILIPFLHLISERFLRKEEKVSANPKTLSLA